MSILSERFNKVDDAIYELVSSQKKRLYELFEISQKTGINDFGWKDGEPVEEEYKDKDDFDTAWDRFVNSKICFIWRGEDYCIKEYCGWRFKFDDGGNIIFTELEEADENFEQETCFDIGTNDNFKAANEVIRIIEKELENVVGKEVLDKKVVLYNQIKERLNELDIYCFVLYTSNYLPDFDYDDEDAGKYLPDEDSDDNNIFSFYEDDNPDGFSGQDTYVNCVYNDRKLRFDLREMYWDQLGTTYELNSYDCWDIVTVMVNYGEEAAIDMLELVLNGTYDENLIELNRIREKRQEDE